MARVLTKNEFGVWILFTSIVSILETLREGFIKQPFIAFLGSANGDDRNNIGSAAFLLNTLYSVVISLGILAVAYPLENFWAASQLGLILKIYAISNLVFIPFSHFEYLQQSKLDFKGIFLSHFVRSLTLTIFVVGSYLFNKEISLLSLAWVSLVGNIIGATISMIWGWQWKHVFKKMPMRNIMDMVKFGRFSFGTNLASLSIRNMDSWMLGKMLSTESVALYNPAIRISNLVEIPTLTVANLVFPKMAQGFGGSDHSYASELYERSVGLLLAIMIPVSISMFLFSDWIVWIVAGKNYAESGYLLQITAFYTLFIPFGRQFGVLLDAVRKPEINFYFILGTAILNIVITYYFIMQWGIAGAAYGTLITYFMRFVVQQIVLNKLLGISTLRVFNCSIDFYGKGFALLKSMTK
ncbi:MAG: flippase [Cyclobacteriaceae bacterium]|nr:flippase [Cyclobacteriaceae bacterium]